MRPSLAPNRDKLALTPEEGTIMPTPGTQNADLLFPDHGPDLFLHLFPLLGVQVGISPVHDHGHVSAVVGQLGQQFRGIEDRGAENGHVRSQWQAFHVHIGQDPEDRLLSPGNGKDRPQKLSAHEVAHEDGADGFRIAGSADYGQGIGFEQQLKVLDTHRPKYSVYRREAGRVSVNRQYQPFTRKGRKTKCISSTPLGRSSLPRTATPLFSYLGGTMTPENIQSLMQEERLFQPPATKRAHIPDMATYEEHYRRADADPEGYWADRARSLITWFKPWDKVMDCDFRKPDIKWFVNGKVNVSYNCLDRHVERGLADKTALIWQGEPEDDVRHISYRELLDDVIRFANILKKLGVRRGDRVALYMPMVPELAVAMLACTRIGATHSIVFAGFSALSLQNRIQDCEAKVLVTADAVLRGGKRSP